MRDGNHRRWTSADLPAAIRGGVVTGRHIVNRERIVADWSALCAFDCSTSSEKPADLVNLIRRRDAGSLRYLAVRQSRVLSRISENAMSIRHASSLPRRSNRARLEVRAALDRCCRGRPARHCADARCQAPTRRCRRPVRSSPVGILSPASTTRFPINLGRRPAHPARRVGFL